uniref:ubiquitinyl hydrolase 1 n=1 Tax=Arcella intermedia TaxID=1963864 RepID=A0A6B2L958_9EUKA
MNEHTLQNVPVNKLESILERKGLKITKTEEDGNCLFRAVAHQVYGDEEMHDVVRKNCMDYMDKERNHFSQFVVEDFTEYIKRKRQDTVYGNHLELQAIAELYNRPILIYTTSEEPLNLFQDEYQTDNPPMRLSYHYGNHYNSVWDPNNSTFGVGLGLPKLVPGEADKQLISQAMEASEQQGLEQQFLNEAIKEAEQQDLTDQIAKQAMEESEYQEVSQQMLDEIKKKTEQEEIEKQLIESEMMELYKKQSMMEDNMYDWQYDQALQMSLWENYKK